MNTIWLSAPGSGKGTISERITKEYYMQYAATGDMLRQNVKMKTPLGIQANKYIQEGQLVPDDLIIKVILNRVNAIGNDSWLLDGFPRTISQAEYLWNFQPVESVINLHVPHDVIIERVKDRWVHLPSGRVYNSHFNRPKVPGHDDLTGEKLVQREDDRPETVKRRLEIYEACIKPMAEFYDKHGVLHEFSGNTTDEIWPKIEAYLDRAIV